MATLRVIRGGKTKDTCYELTEQKTKLGRDPSNDVVVDFISVSRNHALITKQDSHFLLEDLHSRNGTYINGQTLQDRRRLNDGDEIEICEVVFKFYINEPPGSGRDSEIGSESGETGSDILSVGQYLEHSRSEVDASDNSSIVTTLQAHDSSRNWRMGIKPEAKLRAVVKILRTLRELLTLPEVLQAILDGLFEIFPQADQGFIMLHDPIRDRLKLEATRSRLTKQAEVNVSMTIVRKAMGMGEAILSADAAEDSRFNTSDSLQSLQIRSMMCVPLLGKDDERLGVIQLDTNNMVEQFSQDDLDIILAVGTPVSLAITNTRFLQQEIEAKALAKELDFAREIQQGYLPKRLPEATRFDISHYYESAEQVGGDYFDCFALNDGHICLAIGDVAGKGIPAALLMSRLYSAVRTQMLTTNDPVLAAKAVNDEFTFDRDAFLFITMMIVVMNRETGHLRLVNAGHSPLLLCDAGEVTPLGIKGGGMPLGVLDGQEFSAIEAQLNEGSRFAIYSDGFTESINPAGELFGRSRLSELLTDDSASSKQIIDSIVSAVSEFRDGKPQQDDSCLAVVRRL